MYKNPARIELFSLSSCVSLVKAARVDAVGTPFTVKGNNLMSMIKRWFVSLLQMQDSHIQSSSARRSSRLLLVLGSCPL